MVLNILNILKIIKEVHEVQDNRKDVNSPKDLMVQRRQRLYHFHGSLQSKYKVEDYGITLTERWNTENLLYGQILQKDKLAEGLMLMAEASFQPSSG